MRIQLAQTFYLGRIAEALGDKSSSENKETGPRWIPVEEMEPDDNQSVAIRIEINKNPPSFAWTRGYYRSGLWYVHDWYKDEIHYCRKGIEDVTHWMALNAYFDQPDKLTFKGE